MPSAGIHSLPAELLARIFILGANYDFPYHSGPFLFNVEFDKVYHSPDFSFQVLVSHVCHSWRYISTSTSCLWNCLHFRTTRHIGRAQTFLSRCSPRSAASSLTASHLLDILVSTDTPDDSVEGHSNTVTDDELNQIFELITPVTRRWRSFHLDVRDARCKTTARHYLSSCGAAPNLETLQLYHFENFGTRSDLDQATSSLPVVIFNNEVPSLKNVSLIGVNLRWGSTEWDEDPDFFRLIDLNFLELALHPHWTRPTEKYWTQTLRLSPSLQSLSLHHSGPKQTTVMVSSEENGNSPTQGPIILSSLTRLSLLNLDSPSYAFHMLKGLLCENVELLEIGLEYGENQEYGDFTDVVQLLSGYGQEQSLTSLHVMPASHTSPLPNIQNLHTLKIQSLRCSFSSFAELMKVLARLEVMDINFAQISEPEADLGSTKMERGFWEVFTSENREAIFEYAASMIGSIPLVAYAAAKSDSLHPAEVVAPILPNLARFSLSGVPGDIALKILLSRAYSAVNSISVNMPRFLVRRGAKYGRDILDAIISEGGVWVPVRTGEPEARSSRHIHVLIEVQEDPELEDEDSDEEDVESGSTSDGG